MVKYKDKLLSDQDYPLYSVLIPLYKESKQILSHLKESISALEYPMSKLDVKLILEADDYHTINLCKKLKFPNYCEFIYVPVSLPRTKAKACNYALRYVEGEYITIFDAEDRPDKLQLKKAASCFKRNPDIGCLQAELTYYNSSENLLTKFFTIEYKSWFKYSLVALDYLNLPIPLGGSSNHIRRNLLLSLKNWDPFNVTEDADLGIRMTYFNKKASIFNSITEEEAPVKLKIWLSQRTRWIKGHLQTYLVYMANPIKLIRRIGFLSFISFQLFLGMQNICYLLGGIIWLFCILFLLDRYFLFFNFIFPSYLINISIINFFFSYLTHIIISGYIIKINQWHNFKIAVSIFPFYFFLHQIAAILAFIELLFKPYHWNKTPHGNSNIFNTFVD